MIRAARFMSSRARGPAQYVSSTESERACRSGPAAQDAPFDQLRTYTLLAFLAFLLRCAVRPASSNAMRRIPDLRRFKVYWLAHA